MVGLLDGHGGAIATFEAMDKPRFTWNDRDLVKLYDELLPEFGPEIARFVVAWRSADAVYRDAPPTSAEDIEPNVSAKWRRHSKNAFRMQLGLAPMPSGGASETRACLLLSRNAGRPLKSNLDLAHCQVQVTIDGTDTVLLSPLSSEPSSVAKWLADWERRTTVQEGLVAINRINIFKLASKHC